MQQFFSLILIASINSVCASGGFNPLNSRNCRFPLDYVNERPSHSISCPITIPNTEPPGSNPHEASGVTPSSALVRLTQNFRDRFGESPFDSILFCSDQILKNGDRSGPSSNDTSER